jgi:hypothetical protein
MCHLTPTKTKRCIITYESHSTCMFTKLVLVVREPHWRSSMEFDAVGCIVIHVGDRR